MRDLKCSNFLIALEIFFRFQWKFVPYNVWFGSVWRLCSGWLWVHQCRWLLAGEEPRSEQWISCRSSTVPQRNASSIWLCKNFLSRFDDECNDFFINIGAQQRPKVWDIWRLWKLHLRWLPWNFRILQARRTAICLMGCWLRKARRLLFFAQVWYI